MPPIDRKYAKQNLKRAIGHCDDILGYIASTGKGFVDKGNEIEAQTGQFPEEYLVIMANLATFEDGQKLIKDGLVSLEQSF